MHGFCFIFVLFNRKFVYRILIRCRVAESSWRVVLFCVYVSSVFPSFSSLTSSFFLHLLIYVLLSVMHCCVSPQFFLFIVQILMHLCKLYYLLLPALIPTGPSIFCFNSNSLGVYIALPFCNILLTTHTHTHTHFFYFGWFIRTIIVFASLCVCVR